MTETTGGELEALVGKDAASAFAKYFLDQTDSYWEKAEFIGITLPESDMTVGQWVTTPWHLQHLPYQVQFAVFRDGEAYCEGCKRCSRPFYEFEYLLYSVNKPYLTTALWRQKGDDYGHKARVPIHDPQFDLQPPRKALSAAEVGYKPKAPTNYYKRPIPIIKGSDIGELGYVNDGQIDDPDATFTPEPGTYNFRMVMFVSQGHGHFTVFAQNVSQGKKLAESQSQCWRTCVRKTPSSARAHYPMPSSSPMATAAAATRGACGRAACARVRAAASRASPRSRACPPPRMRRSPSGRRACKARRAR